MYMTLWRLFLCYNNNKINNRTKENITQGLFKWLEKKSRRQGLKRLDYFNYFNFLYCKKHFFNHLIIFRT